MATKMPKPKNLTTNRAEAADPHFSPHEGRARRIDRLLLNNWVTTNE